MSFLPSLSTSSTISAILTREGRRKLTSATETFQIVKFAVADDEILYPLMDVDSAIESIDTDDPSIISLPISEPSSNGSSELVNIIWVNQTFTNQTFSNTNTNAQQSINISTANGNTLLLNSDDTTNRINCWFSTSNALGRPFVAGFYRITFSKDIDCYNVNFISPVLNSTTNLNYTTLATGDYLFTALNNNGSGKYTSTSFGSPVIVFSVNFKQTPAYFDLLKQPQNKNNIIIPNFCTVTQVDASKNPVADVQAATLALQINNVLPQ